MLEQLHETAVERPRTVVGPLVWGLEKEEVAMQIAKIRASLPSEVKQAATVTRESERIVETAREDAEQTRSNAEREAERIVAEAKAEAERLIEAAKLEQQRLVAENEILKIAKAQSEEIRTAADKEALSLKRNAEDYAYDVLSKLEGVVGKAMSAIERGKAEVARPDAGAAPAAMPANTGVPTSAVVRERTRVN